MEKKEEVIEIQGISFTRDRLEKSWSMEQLKLLLKQIVDKHIEETPWPTKNPS